MKRKAKGKLAALLALLLALLLTGIFAVAEGPPPAEGDPLPEGDAGLEIIVLADDPKDPVDPPEPPATPAQDPAKPAAKPDGDADAGPAPVYAVRFLVGEGKREAEAVFAVLSLTEGDPIPAPEGTPQAEGLVFAHWYDVRGTAETPFLFDRAVTEDLALRAFFTAEPVLTDEPLAGTEGGGEPELVIFVIPDDPIPLAGPELIVTDDLTEDADSSAVSDLDEAPGTPPDTGALVIDFHMVVPDEFRIGDDIVFTSVLDGFEDLEVSLQWQVKTPGGDWRDIDGATGESYTLHTSSENVAYVYRVTAVVWP